VRYTQSDQSASEYERAFAAANALIVYDTGLVAPLGIAADSFGPRGCAIAFLPAALAAAPAGERDAALAVVLALWRGYGQHGIVGRIEEALACTGGETEGVV